eukprot:CAMPEP_0197864710 /NCGR_PEP_ID=MMETSP1438-20131217/43168_1 /TAXON_ID=1461541 /ORGANISM="Pterosperma sp., Strain CCMP1384" /LENGTH=145 /DNA_ID=CAMNT_0043483059 /DNA_START=515 /DNA_END=952 /DNA_ORIENTATION=+
MAISMRSVTGPARRGRETTGTCHALASDAQDHGVPDLVCSQEEYEQMFTDAGATDLVVVAWVATWCRKCIYMKPKLHKLFKELGCKYVMFVDSNSMPGQTCQKAGLKNLPTIQVWRAGEKLAEVVGGDDKKVVMEKVGAMISEYI